MTLELKQERQAFEEFMRSQNNGDRLELDEDGSYADISIEYAWSGWKARAKQTIWIAVEEQLPQANKKILTVKGGEVMTHVIFNGKYFIGFYHGTADKYVDGVTHWQYLPSK